MNNILLKPIITEKSMREATVGRFTFAVAVEANKPAIKKAVEEVFKVRVTHIDTTTIKGRTRRAGKKRRSVVIAPFKKAIVALAQGQKIDYFDITDAPKP